MAEAVRNAARAALDEARAARAKILRSSRQRRAYTLGEFWELTHLPSLSNKREGTRKQQKYRWEQWIDPYLGKLAWKQITAPRIAEWLATVQARDMAGPMGGKGKRLATSTVRNLFATLSAVLSHAVAIGHLHASPAIAARRYLPKYVPSEQAKNRERALTREHALVLMTNPRLAAWTRTEMAFAIYCCTRRGETHGLQWQHVRPNGTRRDPTPHVRIERSHSGPTKTGSSTRDIPMHPELAPILDRYRAVWTKRFKREPGPEDFVFPAPSGGMRAKNSGSRMRKIAKSAGVPRITYHGLRHTGATLYRASGVRREDVAAILGHVGTVTDLYAPPLLPLLHGEIQKLKLIAAPGIRSGQDAVSPAEEDRSRGEVDSPQQAAVAFNPMDFHPPNDGGIVESAHSTCVNPDNPPLRPAHITTQGAAIGAQYASAIVWGEDGKHVVIGHDDPAPATEREPKTSDRFSFEDVAELWRGIL